MNLKQDIVLYVGQSLWLSYGSPNRMRLDQRCCHCDLSTTIALLRGVRDVVDSQAHFLANDVTRHVPYDPFGAYS